MCRDPGGDIGGGGFRARGEIQGCGKGLFQRRGGGHFECDFRPRDKQNSDNSFHLFPYISKIEL